jgi:molybdopterin-guanine dinucleotide biosynthesis protein
MSLGTLDCRFQLVKNKICNKIDFILVEGFRTEETSRREERLNTPHIPHTTDSVFRELLIQIAAECTTLQYSLL